MEITTLAAWGEFIGGIAVVVSLVYLASQIRQNSRLVRSSTTAASNQTQMSFNSLLIQDAEVARIWWDGLDDRDSLSESDRRRFDPMIQLHFQTIHQEFEFIQENVGSTRMWEQQERSMRWSMQQRGVQQWWIEWGELFPQQFRDYVVGAIREGQAAA